MVAPGEPFASGQQVTAPHRAAVRPVVKFGPFTFDPSAKTLRRGDDVVRLYPQAARVLEYLLIRAPEVVPRHDLKRLVWGARPFGARDNGLNFCIRQIRAALGESGSDEGYLQTVRRSGYRISVEAERAELVDDRLPARLLEAIADVVVVTDEIGRVTWVNSAIESATGFTPAEVLAQSAFDFVLPSDRALASRTFAECAVEPGSTRLARFRVLNRGGGPSWKDVRLHNRMSDPEVRGLVLVFRDLADERVEP